MFLSPAILIVFIATDWAALAQEWIRQKEASDTHVHIPAPPPLPDMPVNQPPLPPQVGVPLCFAFMPPTQ